MNKCHLHQSPAETRLLISVVCLSGLQVGHEDYVTTVVVLPSKSASQGAFVSGATNLIDLHFGELTTNVTLPT